MVISITGPKGSGKDQVCKYILKHSKTPFYKKQFAGKLKQIISLLTGCSLHDLENQEFKESKIGGHWKDWTFRKLMQTVGTQGLRNSVDENIHINSLFTDYNKEHSNWVITDLRFLNEAQAIKERNGIIVKVVRSSIISDDTHQSEEELKQIKADYLILNNGTLELLEHEVIKFLNYYKL